MKQILGKKKTQRLRETFNLPPIKVAYTNGSFLSHQVEVWCEGVEGFLVVDPKDPKTVLRLAPDGSVHNHL